MDCLITFSDTQSVLQAEQILVRRRIPFETVPHSLFNRSRCGLAILLSEEYTKGLRVVFEKAQLKSEFIQVDRAHPFEKRNKPLTIM